MVISTPTPLLPSHLSETRCPISTWQLLAWFSPARKCRRRIAASSSLHIAVDLPRLCFSPSSFSRLSVKVPPLKSMEKCARSLPFSSSDDALISVSWLVYILITSPKIASPPSHLFVSSLKMHSTLVVCMSTHTHTHTHTSLGNSTIHIAFLQTSWTLWPSQSTLLWTWTAYCKQYILISPWFCWELGYVRFVLYDMMLRSWKNLNVAKDWIFSCPISQQIHYLAHPHDFD